MLRHEAHQPGVDSCFRRLILTTKDSRIRELAALREQSRSSHVQHPDKVLTQTVRRGSGFSSEERRDQTIALQAEFEAASGASTGPPHEPEDFRATRLPEVGLEPTQGITPTGF